MYRVIWATRFVPAICLPRNLSRRVEKEEHRSSDIILIPNKVEVCGHACDLRIANVRAIPQQSGKLAIKTGTNKYETKRDGAYKKERR